MRGSPRRWIPRLAWFARAALFESALMAETLVWLTAARLAEHHVSFPWLAVRLGRQNTESAPATGEVDAARARRVMRAIARWADRLPWSSSCLVRALAGHAMLRRRGLPHTLYLGVHAQDQWIEPHAWLRCGAVMVTGDGVPGARTVVASYAWGTGGSVPGDGGLAP